MLDKQQLEERDQQSKSVTYDEIIHSLYFIDQREDLSVRQLEGLCLQMIRMVNRVAHLQDFDMNELLDLNAVYEKDTFELGMDRVDPNGNFEPGNLKWSHGK